MNQMINMAIRILMRTLMTVGVSKGIDYAYRDKKTDDNSPQSREARKQSKKTAQNAKRTLRMIRRIGRF